MNAQTFIDALFEDTAVRRTGGIREGWIGGYADYWLKPDGLLVNVHFSHEETAQELFPEEMEGLSGPKVYDKMFEMGWARVLFNPGSVIFIDTSRELTRAQLQNMTDMAIERKLPLKQTNTMGSNGAAAGGRRDKVLWEPPHEDSPTD